MREREGLETSRLSKLINLEKKRQKWYYITTIEWCVMYYPMKSMSLKWESLRALSIQNV